MADSNLVIPGSVVVTGGAGQLIAEWAPAADASVFAGWPNMAVAVYEVWVSITSSYGVAGKVGETTSTQYLISDLGVSVTRWVWIRPRDKSGNVGVFTPSTTGAGATGTTTNQIPTVGSLDELTPNPGSLSGGIYTAGRFRTSVSGARVEITASDNSLKFYNRSGVLKGEISYDRNSAVSLFQFDLGDGGIDGAFFRNDPGVAVFGRNNSVYAAVLGEAYNRSGAGGAFYNQGSGVAGGIRLAEGSLSGGWGARAVSGNGIYSTVFAPFTGGHEALIDKLAQIDIGDIVCDVRVVARSGISDTITEVVRATVYCQRAVVGVVARRSELPIDMQMAALPPPQDGKSTFLYRKLREKFDYLFFNAVGEGQMNVCGRGGNIQAGDLICASDLYGKGQRQNDTDGNADDLHRRCTVAKARETVTFDFPDQVRRVACIYLCG